MSAARLHRFAPGTARLLLAWAGYLAATLAAVAAATASLITVIVLIP